MFALACFALLQTIFVATLADAREIDRRFERNVLLPGFIDPQVHPFLAAKLLPYDIAAPEAWNRPRKIREIEIWGTVYEGRASKAL